MIDYFFPPLAGSAVQRTLGYAKHLEGFGWSPIVLTVRKGEHFFYDDSLLQRVPATVSVHRTMSLEPIRFGKWLLNQVNGVQGEPTNGQRGDRYPSSAFGWAREFERWVLFPDRRIGWLPFALARSLSLCRHEQIDVVYSTSTAVTSHLVAYFLKAILGRPWVADFQDPWSENDSASFASPVHKWAAGRLEYLILRTADRVTVTTEPFRQLLQKKYHAISASKVAVIPMGFDAEVLKNAAPRARRAKFTVTHFGNFYHPRSPGPFLLALGHCLERDRMLADHLDVFFLGTFDAEMRSLTRELIDRYRLGDVVQVRDPVPYQAGLEYLRGSDVLLLVTDAEGGGRNLVPSKLYEYLAVGRRVLALAPNGAAADIVRAARAGVVVDPGDIDAIRDAILALYADWREGRLKPTVDREFVLRYEWKRLTEQLASTLEAVREPQAVSVPNRAVEHTDD